MSTWHLDLPPEDNAFDLTTVSDVVLNVRYTAISRLNRAGRRGPGQPHGGRTGERRAAVVLDQELGAEWQRFLSPGPNADQVLTFTLDRRYLPFAFRSAANVRLIAARPDRRDVVDRPFEVQLTVPGAAAASTEALAPDPAMRGAHHLVKTAFNPPASPLGTWSMKIRTLGRRRLPLSDAGRPARGLPRRRVHLVVKDATAVDGRGSGRLASEIAPMVVDTVVACCDPDAVVLFGSWAKGTADVHSDIDLLVIGRSAPRRGCATGSCATRCAASPSPSTCTW